MTKTQKILIVVAGGVGFLWLASRTRSASTAPVRTLPPDRPQGDGEIVDTVQPPPEGDPEMVVSFASGSSTLTTEQIRQFNVLRQNKYNGLIVAADLHGYSSRSGSAQQNYELTIRRIAAVAGEFMARWPDIDIQGYAHGEAGATGNDAQDRRVDCFIYYEHTP